MVYFIKHFRPYLHAVLLTVQMNHAALEWALTGPQKSARCARQALKLQAYLFEVRHRKGTEKANADAVSRPPIAFLCTSSSPQDRDLARVLPRCGLAVHHLS